jgi:hypothetical protein
VDGIPEHCQKRQGFWPADKVAFDVGQLPLLWMFLSVGKLHLLRVVNPR